MPSPANALAATLEREDTMGGEAYYAIVDRAGVVSDASRLPLDALSLGKGVFETLLVTRGALALCAEHAERMKRSCRELGIASEMDVDAIFSAAERLATEQSRRGRMRMRIAVFAGGERGACGLLALRDAPQSRKPLSLAFSGVVRRAGDPLVRHKAANYLANSLVHEAARRAGFDDAVLLDDAGHVAETTTANVFIESGGVLLTPREGAILPGIARAWILKSAPVLGITVVEGDIARERLFSASAAFITNSIVGLAPVVRIDANTLPDASQAEWFTRLSGAWRKACGDVAD